MDKVYTTRVTFSCEGVRCEGCKVVDHLKCENDDFYLIEYDIPFEDHKYGGYFDMVENSVSFKTKEEAYRYAAEFYQKMYQKSEKVIRKIEKLTGDYD